MEPYAVVLVALHILLLVVGIPGNLLIILVTAQRRYKKSVHVKIIALAIVDSFACWTAPLGIHYWMYDTACSYPVMLCKFYVFCSFISTFGTMFMTNALALDRYFAVCHPLTVIITPFRAFVACIGCAVASVLLSIAANFGFGVRQYWPFVTVCAVTDNPWLVETIYGLIVLIFAVTSIVITILYLQMCVMVRRQARLRARVAPDPTTLADRNRQTNNRSLQTTVSGRVQQQREQPKVPSRQNAFTVKANAASRECNPSTSQTIPSLSSNKIAPSNNIAPSNKIAPTSSVPLLLRPSPTAAKCNHRTSLSLKPISAQDLAPDVPTLASRLTNKTTKMLLLATLFFIVSWLPNIIIKGLPSASYHRLVHLNSSLVALVKMVEYMFLINHVANPFVYSLVNQRFKHLCVQYLQDLLQKITNKI